MRILVICDKIGLSKKMDLNLLNSIIAFKPFCEIYFWGNGWDEYAQENIESIEDIINPDLIYFYGDYAYTPWWLATRVKGRKAIYFEDYWDNFHTRLNILKYGNFDYLITRNLPGINKYLNCLPKLRHIVNPHGYNSKIFHPDYSLNKKYDFVVCGRIDSRYPFRQKMLGLLSNLMELGFKIYNKPHAGYWDAGEEKIDNGQIDFAKVLNSSKVVVGGCAHSNYNCHMAKIFEISATSALCFTDANPIEPDYHRIKQHVFCVDLTLEKNELLEQAIKAIEISEEYKDRMFKLVQYATFENRAKQLIKRITMFL